MKLDKPSLLDVMYVAHHMRDWDRREVFAGRFSDDPDTLAMDIMRHGHSWVVGDERAIAVVGAVEILPGGWSVLMFSTDEFPKIALSLTRFIKKRMIPLMIGWGARWAECRSVEGHDQAHGWLEVLGAKRDRDPLLNYGKNGETFFRFAWEK